jgi:hypothetical protein
MSDARIETGGNMTGAVHTIQFDLTRTLFRQPNAFALRALLPKQ